jgi:hypothetical protein
MDHVLWKDAPFGFHLSHLALYMACALLVYAFSVSLGLERPVGIMAALIATLHPSNFFNVIWISARDAVLCLLFCLLSCLLFLFFLTRERHRPLLWFGSFVFYLFGVLSKESLVCLPLFLVGLGFFLKCWEGSRNPSCFMRSALLPALPFFLFSLGFTYWYFSAGRGASLGYMAVSADSSWMSNLVTTGRNLILYCLAFLFYIPPSFFQYHLPLPLALLGVAAPLGLGWFLVSKRDMFEDRRPLILSLLWILVFILIPLGFRPAGRAMIFSLCGYGLFAGMVVDSIRKAIVSPRRRTIATSVLLFCILLFPAFADLALIPHLNEEARKQTVHFDEMLYDLVRKHPEGTDIFLLNSPHPMTTFTLSMMFSFHHPDMQQRFHVLSNIPYIPDMQILDERTLRISHAEGVIRTGPSGFHIRHLKEGQRCHTDALSAEIEGKHVHRIDAITYTFSRPLKDPACLFVRTTGGEIERVPFDGIASSSSS